MKILLMIIMTAVFAMAWKVEITGQGVRVWKDWGKRTKPVAILAPGGEYEVVEEYAPWYEVEVVTDRRKGETGIVWSERVSNGVIVGQGVAFRMEPRVAEETRDGVLFPGARVRILGKMVNRYRIRANEFAAFQFGEGWVWAGRCERMK